MRSHVAYSSSFREWRGPEITFPIPTAVHSCSLSNLNRQYRPPHLYRRFQTTRSTRTFNSKGQSPWEDNSSSDSQRIPRILLTRRFIIVFEWTRTCPYSEPYQSSLRLKIRLNIILPSTPKSSKWPLSQRFPHQNAVCSTYRLPRCATCPAHLDLMSRIILGEEYRSIWLSRFQQVVHTRHT